MSILDTTESAPAAYPVGANATKRNHKYPSLRIAAYCSGSSLKTYVARIRSARSCYLAFLSNCVKSTNWKLSKRLPVWRSSKSASVPNGPSPTPTAVIEMGYADASHTARLSSWTFEISPSVRITSRTSYFPPCARTISIALRIIGAIVVGPSWRTIVTAYLYAYSNAWKPTKCGSMHPGANSGATLASFVSAHPKRNAGIIPSSSNLGKIGSRTRMKCRYGFRNPKSCNARP